MKIQKINLGEGSGVGGGGGGGSGRGQGGCERRIEVFCENSKKKLGGGVGGVGGLRIILNSLHKHSCSLGVDCFSISLLILSNPELVLFFRVFIAACTSHIFI